MTERRLQSGRKAPFGAEAALLIALGCVSISACAAPIDGGEPQAHVGRSIQAIVNGIASGADQDSVVMLARFENGARVGLCTATLVAPNLLLTARHCVSMTDPAAACGSDGQPVVGALLHGDRAPGTLAMFASAGGAAVDTTSDALATARGKTLVVDDATTICNHDLAFVVLDRAVTGPVAQVRLAAPASGETLTAVGFGITEAGALPSARRQRSGLALVGAGPMAYPDDARYGVGDGEFLVGESACSGDSGSPMLAHASGAVVGVASRAGNGQPRDPNNPAATCLGATAHAVYTQLGANPAFAMRAFKEAKAAPWLEGQPDPRAAHPSSQGGSSSSSSGAANGANKSGEPAPSAAGAGAEVSGASNGSGSGGCSASGEPIRGSVEHALGIVAVVLLVLRLRSARRRREAKGNERVPYVDLGMRESFASLSDDR